mgnify:CR=1 FL=1
MEKKRTVIKVGTSTLTYENGKINYRRVEQLCKVLSDLQNRGEQVIFVSSGAIAVGMGKAGLDKRPTETKKKQALAAIGQCELMFMYDKLFGEYNHSVAQLLLTRHAVETEQKRQNVINTIDELLRMNIIPVINENDTVTIDELEATILVITICFPQLSQDLLPQTDSLFLRILTVCTIQTHEQIQMPKSLILSKKSMQKFLKWRQVQAQTVAQAV